MARKMKDSGIEWIGEIPEGWEIQKLKYYATVASGEILSRDEYNFSGDIPVIGSNGKIGTTYKSNNHSEVITTGRVGTIGTAQIVQDAWITDNALIIKSHSINRPFLTYVIPNFDFKFMLSGTAQPLITATKLKNQYIPVPSSEVQDKLVQYLNTQIFNLSHLISQACSSIELYKKLKQAVITQAVTKGVRGEREMKNCNIGWIKELPADWGTIPSKYLFKNSDTKKCNGDEQLTASQQHGIITQKYYTELTGPKVVLANKGLDDWKHVEPFDFIISLRSFQGGLEMSETTGCITWHYIVLKPCHQIYSYYYKWLFKSEIYIRALQRTCNFIRDGQDLRYSNFVQVPLFEPPLEEQKEIADYLNGKCAEIDGLISKKEQLVKELESYKKSLIYEVVTGKREV